MKFLLLAFIISTSLAAPLAKTDSGYRSLENAHNQVEERRSSGYAAKKEAFRARSGQEDESPFFINNIHVGHEQNEPSEDVGSAHTYNEADFINFHVGHNNVRAY